MTKPTNQIGFSQRVRLEWLEQTANLVLAGNDKVAISDALQKLLKDKVSVGGQAERGNREKTITILLKIWLSTPPELETLRIKGLELLKVPDPEDSEYMRLRVIEKDRIWVIADGQAITFMKPSDY